MNKTKFWLKLAGLALLLHIILIALSIFEVAIYSYLVAPGGNEAFYQVHAQVSGPWVSGICGSVLVFLFVRSFTRKHREHQFTYALALPLIYIVMDVLMLLPFHINWTEHLPIFLAANGAKTAASFLSYLIYRRAIR